MLTYLSVKVLPYVSAKAEKSVYLRSLGWKQNYQLGKGMIRGSWFVNAWSHYFFQGDIKVRQLGYIFHSKLRMDSQFDVMIIDTVGTLPT